MMTSTPSHPLDAHALLGYWLAELEEEQDATIEAHLFECEGCSRRLAELTAVAAGVRELFGHGLTPAVVSGSFVKRLIDKGLKVREYRVARGGSVNCTVAPEDELVVGRLGGRLEGIERLDFVSRDASGNVQERRADVPFDPLGNELVFTTHLPSLRALGRATMRVALVSVTAGGEEVIGEYVFRHEPWRSGG